MRSSLLGNSPVAVTAPFMPTAKRATHVERQNGQLQIEIGKMLRNVSAALAIQSGKPKKADAFTTRTASAFLTKKSAPFSKNSLSDVLFAARNYRKTACASIIATTVALFGVSSATSATSGLPLSNDRGFWTQRSHISKVIEAGHKQADDNTIDDFLENPPKELFNDAYFTPKMAAVPISLTMEEILNNEGPNQIFDVMREYIRAAEVGLAEGMDTALYGDGTTFGGRAIGGLGLAVPITAANGLYGGINRTNFPIWQTSSYNINSDFPTIGTQFTSVTAKPILDEVMGLHARGRRGPDLLLMSPQHWDAYNQATISIQRITNDSGVGRLGFRTLQYLGPTGAAEIVFGGGLNSQMPDNTTFALETDSLRLRYNPDRNFDKLFEGDGQKPINQDAIAQFIGWMGELTMVNPRFNFRLYDSAP